MSRPITYTIIIPCYNSRENLRELIFRIKNSFTSCIKEPFEIILVDDHSSCPNTWKIIEMLVNENKEVRALQLTRNFGKPGALMCGYQNSRGNFVIVMDDDLQHLPEDIPLLIEKKDHDIVMAKFNNKQHGKTEQFGSWLWNYMMFILFDKPKNITISPFNLVNRTVVNALIKISSPRPMLGALYLYVTNDIVMVDVDHMPRIHGKSGFTFRKRVSQFSNLLINNSSFLLKLVSFLGMTIALVSIVYAFWLIMVWYFYGSTLQGWTSLMVVITFLGGVILVSLGVIGEYLYRIVNGLERRPAFIVAKELNHSEV